VMAEAVAAGTAVILTSDPDDLELLRDAAGLSKDQVEIIGVGHRLSRTRRPIALRP